MLQLNFVSYRYNFLQLNSFAMPIWGPVFMLKVFYDGKNGGKERGFFPEGILSIQLSVMVPLETLESSLHVTSLKEPVPNFLMTAVDRSPVPRRLCLELPVSNSLLPLLQVLCSTQPPTVGPRLPSSTRLSSTSSSPLWRSRS